MSLRMMAEAWKRRLPAAEKLVLLALADFADDEGGHIFPAVATVADKAGLDRRTVQRALANLRRKRGILVAVGSRRGGRAHTTQYRLVMAKGRHVAADNGKGPVKGGNEPPFRGGKGGTLSRKGGNLPPDPSGSVIEDPDPERTVSPERDRKVLGSEPGSEQGSLPLGYPAAEAAGRPGGGRIGLPAKPAHGRRRDQGSRPLGVGPDLVITDVRPPQRFSEVLTAVLRHGPLAAGLRRLRQQEAEAG